MIQKAVKYDYYNGGIVETITVLGAGYVGLTTATIFANSGYIVYLVEPNPKRLEVIKSGKAFFFEQGIDPLVESAIKAGSLIPTDSYTQAIPKSKFIFSCVGTPDNPDGSSNLSYVFSAAESAAELMKPGTIYIQKSTVPVGTGRKVTDVISKKQKNFSYVSNPEFLREGTALSDSLYFDHVVVGGTSHKANQKVLDIYVNVETKRNEIAEMAGITVLDTSGKYVETNLNGAELVKVTANAFLALKISFANNIAKLADKAGANINEIMDAVGADRRIGRAFLNAGRGYGGGCFPKDVSGLISTSLEHGVSMPIMLAAQEINESMPLYVVEKAYEVLGTLKSKKIAVLGLAFKPGTSDVRSSPAIKIANILNGYGATVRAYDPFANEEAKEDISENVSIHGSTEEAIRDADAVFVATDWSEFKDINMGFFKKMRGNLIVDCMNIYKRENIEEAGFKYIGIGT